jgi:hypothetical protein
VQARKRAGAARLAAMIEEATSTSTFPRTRKNGSAGDGARSRTDRGRACTPRAACVIDASGALVSRELPVDMRAESDMTLETG